MTLTAPIDQALVELGELIAAPYDGVQCSLPEWMPEPLKIEFRQLRVGLLSDVCRECQVKHTPKEIRRWLDVYCSTGETSSIAHARDLRDLDYIQSIANLGQESGFEAYMGKGQSAVYRRDVFARRDRDRAVAAGQASGRSRRQPQRDRRIREAAEAGRTPKQIAHNEELSPSTVRRIINRQPDPTPPSKGEGCETPPNDEAVP